MNRLLFIIPTDLKDPFYIKRIITSLDIACNINIVIINQSKNDNVENHIVPKKAVILNEIKTKGIVPLSVARNMALTYLYENYDDSIKNTLTLFVDDDAWYPEETLQFLLAADIKSYAIQTIDPDTNKSFVKSRFNNSEIKGHRLITDICSICLIVPFHCLKQLKLVFNERIGLGNTISQGEESVFIYALNLAGIKIYGKNYFVYHPYKKTFNKKNFYSLAYFFSYGFHHISKSMFFVPYTRNILKYTVAGLLFIKDRRYISLFKQVWKGTVDGIKNSENISL